MLYKPLTFLTESTRFFDVTPIQLTCLDVPVQEEDLGKVSKLTCAHACVAHSSCFMFRYHSGICSLIGQGESSISDTSDLYKIT